MKHVLAALDGQGEPIAYLSLSKCWTSDLTAAASFGSRHEADDYLHANAHDDNPGPVRSLCIAAAQQAGQIEAETVEASELSPHVRLYTGIYG